MPISGTLNIIGQQAFLDPDDGQVIDEETLMMMKNLPPNGNQQDRINAAPAYFRGVLHKDTGDDVSVTASVQPFGAKQILVVEQ